MLLRNTRLEHAESGTKSIALSVCLYSALRTRYAQSFSGLFCCLHTKTTLENVWYSTSRFLANEGRSRPHTGIVCVWQ